MKTTTKIVAWLCIFSTLFVGCYTQTTLTADSPKSEMEVKFQLKDGTFVRSTNYERVENGYKVVGTLINKENTRSKDFSGILLDAQIKAVVPEEEGTSPAFLVFVCVVIATIGGCLYGYAHSH